MHNKFVLLCNFLLVLMTFAVVGLPINAQSGDIIYKPFNPSFGGNPLNSGHFRGLAEAQKQENAFGSSGGSSLSGSNGLTNAQRFISSLESRLLSNLSRQVADAIFGENPQDSGRVVFGDTEVTFVRGAETIQLIIIDPEAGETRIEVPILQVQ